MKLNIFYALSALPLLAAARPADDNVVHKQDGSIIVGPQAYEELQATVEGLKSGGKLGDLAACSGLYLCEHADFKGRCYWGCYPNGLDVYPDPFWQENITAVGPDQVHAKEDDPFFSDTLVETCPEK
ncbi:hypothetical protein FQN57_006365 [Myotisia sp. PD_48]|nr:hypothetical protein FQN57_006365 [Myotisia sp. PD_48]